ncbi:MAG TPA: antibiotic biosynthesis monooxygenase [Anaerolineales bacterium]
MVITVLEGHIKAENWSAFQIDYQSRIIELPPQMVQTYLLQSATDQTLWQIISVWESREALDEMRNSGETPAGVLVFRNVGVEPKLSIFSVPLSAP